MEERKSCSCKSVGYFVASFFFGFVAVRSRILNTPLFVRLSLYIAATWPVALPTMLMYVDDVLGFIFSYGIVAKNYYFTPEGPSYTLLFFYYVIIPFLIIISAISTKKFWFWAIFFDVCAAVAIMAHGLYVAIWLTIPENVGLTLMWVSFAFTWIPLILFVVVIIWLVQMYKHKDDPNRALSTVPLLND